MSIDDYKLEKPIGSGTFGDVFRGIEIKTGMKVAIKRIKKKILYENGKYLLKAYYREIDIMKKCACENSINLLKEFQTQNNYNIIMELCDTDLLVYLYERPNPFSADEVRETFAQLNNAFRKMSQYNILHRDLKLGNVLIKFTDESKTHFIPKLSDYGFSKELNNYNYAACTHLGTPATMAPEIMMNKPYNEKSDLWSVGVMMYQLYYREVPYEGNSENEILNKIQSNSPYKQPDEPDLRDLINKLLVFNDKNRLSWDEYFNHPFFRGCEKYINNNFTVNNDSIYNTCLENNNNNLNCNNNSNENNNYSVNTLTFNNNNFNSNGNNNYNDNNLNFNNNNNRNNYNDNNHNFNNNNCNNYNDNNLNFNNNNNNNNFNNNNLNLNNNNNNNNNFNINNNFNNQNNNNFNNNFNNNNNINFNNNNNNNCNNNNNFNHNNNNNFNNNNNNNFNNNNNNFNNSINNFNNSINNNFNNSINNFNNNNNNNLNNNYNNNNLNFNNNNNNLNNNNNKNNLNFNNNNNNLNNNNNKNSNKNLSKSLAENETNYTFNHFEKTKPKGNIFGYSFSSEVFDDFNFGGNIYEGKEKNFSSTNLLFTEFDKKFDIESKINLIKRGQAINNKEYQIIISNSIESLDNNNNQFPLSRICQDKIQKNLGGEWAIFILDEQDNNYDFFITDVEENEIIFKYKNCLFHVSRIK